ncbi:DUF4913 domain-containing protein [Corynebacterium mastitidis]
MDEKNFKYPTVYHFVEEFLAVMYPTADERDARWAPYWFRHREAVIRLTALWKRFEQLRVEEPTTYMETFLRVHGDYHMGLWWGVCAMPAGGYPVGAVAVYAA